MNLKFGGATSVQFMDNNPWDWIILTMNKGCLFYTHLILNWLPESTMLRPLGIKVFSLCIQSNSLLSLIDFDLGMSFGNLMYSSIYMIHTGISLISVSVKMSGHCDIIIVFDVKKYDLGIYPWFCFWFVLHILCDTSCILNNI